MARAPPSLVRATLAIPAQARSSAAQVMFDTAVELQAHGHAHEAVALLRRALAEGLPTGELHVQSCLLPLRGCAPYEALAHPVR